MCSVFLIALALETDGPPHQLTVFESAIYSLSAAVNYLLMYGETKTNGLGREH